MKEILEKLQRRITDAAMACGRDPQSVQLVAVTKTVSAQRVAEAVDAGVTIVGENYIQEARDKFNHLYDRKVSWHFIGHLQSNKAKYAVRQFSLIHSVDSLRLAAEIDREARKAGKIQPILIQVNVAGEATKSGIDPEALIDLVRSVSALSHVRVAGLMTMPPFSKDPEASRPHFRRLKALADHCAASVPGIDLRELSMGMSGDFEVAVSEGATLVRIGTAIFGERS